MTDETRKLFDAPWTGGMRKDRLSEEYVVVSDHNSTITAHVDTKENANRLARLPELYDELQRMIHVECLSRCSRSKLCSHPCDLVRPAVELLRKVRDGE